MFLVSISSDVKVYYIMLCFIKTFSWCEFIKRQDVRDLGPSQQFVMWMQPPKWKWMLHFPICLSDDKISMLQKRWNKQFSTQVWMLTGITLYTCEYNFNTRRHHGKFSNKTTGVITCVVNSNWSRCGDSPKCILYCPVVLPWWLSSSS